MVGRNWHFYGAPDDSGSNGGASGRNWQFSDSGEDGYPPEDREVVDSAELLRAEFGDSRIDPNHIVVDSAELLRAEFGDLRIDPNHIVVDSDDLLRAEFGDLRIDPNQRSESLDEDPQPDHR
jgi:hypothetical protein